MKLTYEIKKQHGWRITGWDIDNSPEIERAFREGFLWGARRAVKLPDYEIEPIFDQMMRKRGNLYWFRKWDDVKAAELRGKSHGLWYVFDHLSNNGTRQSCLAWFEEVERWAAENPPKMDSRHAMPPELRYKKVAPSGGNSNE